MKVSGLKTRILQTPADNPLVVGLPPVTTTREFVALEVRTDDDDTTTLEIDRDVARDDRHAKRRQHSGPRTKRGWAFSGGHRIIAV